MVVQPPINVAHARNPEGDTRNSDHDNHLAAVPVLLVIHRRAEREERDEEGERPEGHRLEVPRPVRVTEAALSDVRVLRGDRRVGVVGEAEDAAEAVCGGGAVVGGEDTFDDGHVGDELVGVEEEAAGGLVEEEEDVGA